MNFRVCDVLFFVPESEKSAPWLQASGYVHFFFGLMLRSVDSICLSVGPLTMKLYRSSHAYQVFVLCE